MYNSRGTPSAEMPEIKDQAACIQKQTQVAHTPVSNERITELQEGPDPNTRRHF